MFLRIAKPAAMICAGLGVLALSPAQAAPIQMLASSSAHVLESPSQAPVMDSDTASAGEVWSDAGSEGIASYSYAAAAGNEFGDFGVAVHGRGHYDTQASFSYQWTVDNDSLSAQAYQFAFEIQGGMLSVDHPRWADEGGFSTYSFDISFGGVTLLSSAVSLQSTGELSESGTQLNNVSLEDFPTYGYFYYWDTTAFNIDLGVLQSGESAELVYQLTAQTSGWFDGYCDSPNEEWGIECAGSGMVEFGDPASLSSDAEKFDISFTPVSAGDDNQVPTPGTLALLGAAGLLWAGRRARTLRR